MTLDNAAELRAWADNDGDDERATTMRSHEITVDGRARIVASIEEWRQTLASGTSRDGYVKHLTMSRWMFYVLKNGEQDFESTDMDDAIKRYNDL